MAPCPRPAVDLDQIAFVGAGLDRPECVLATRTGVLYASDGRGGVAVVDTDGTVTPVIGRGDGPRSGVKPNGIALRRDGTMLLAHLDDREGGVWTMGRDGRLKPFLTELDGRPVPPTNFVIEDSAGRVWVSVSTRRIPREPARRPDHADGYIVLVDGRGARIVADGLGFTNEAKVDPTGGWLYVNETYAPRLSRFPIRDGDRLGPRQTVAEFPPGTFPDGLEFDRDGGVWITSVFSNRVVRIGAEGGQRLLLEDNDPAFVARIERDFRSGALAGQGHPRVPGRLLRNVSSIAFGGPDLRTAYLGCLQGDRIATFRSPVAGAPPPHWERAWGP